jgi:hypothetical protein
MELARHWPLTYGRARVRCLSSELQGLGRYLPTVVMHELPPSWGRAIVGVALADSTPLATGARARGCGASFVEGSHRLRHHHHSEQIL